MTTEEKEEIFNYFSEEHNLSLMDDDFYQIDKANKNLQDQLLKLLDLTTRVRNLQVKYFEFRDKNVLINAKRTEKLLDNYLVDLHIEIGTILKPTPAPPKLF